MGLHKRNCGFVWSKGTQRSRHHFEPPYTVRFRSRSVTLCSSPKYRITHRWITDWNPWSLLRKCFLRTTFRILETHRADNVYLWKTYHCASWGHNCWTYFFIFVVPDDFLNVCVSAQYDGHWRVGPAAYCARKRSLRGPQGLFALMPPSLGFVCFISIVISLHYANGRFWYFSNKVNI